MTNIHKLGWYGLSRQAIPGVMLGMEPVSQLSHSSPEAALASSADIAVAFQLDEPAHARTPRLAVVPDHKVPELLSWLHTFSLETFPLSQYCRVLSQTDWQRVSRDGGTDWGLSRRYRWASMVAGEMLAQAETMGTAFMAPLGWAHGCLSYALARTVMVYGASQAELPLMVADRLSRCEADNSFQRKRITARTLSSIWPHIEQQQGVDVSPAEAAHAVVGAVHPQLEATLRANHSITSSSAERRVQGFDEVIDAAMTLDIHGGQRDAVGPMLSGAAFLVGSGTSHISLIEPYAREFPEAFAWFGLLAGIAGPKSWDASWMRLVKGVERLLSANYSIADAPQADLSWLEYEWVSNVGTGAHEGYIDLPKQNARSLTIELVPGVACQFRFAGNANSQSKAADSAPRAPAIASRAGVSFEKVARARELARELQMLLAGDSDAPAQPALFDTPSPAPAQKKKANQKKTTAKVRDA